MKTKKALALSVVLIVGFVGVNMFGEESSVEHKNNKKAKMIDEEVFCELQSEFESPSEKGCGHTLFVKSSGHLRYEDYFRIEDFTSEKIDDFKHHIKMLNVCKCYDLLEIRDENGELKRVDVVIYGKNVRNTNHCTRLKKSLTMSKLKKQDVSFDDFS